MATVTPEKADILRQALQKLFGVTVTLDEVDDALYAIKN